MDVGEIRLRGSAVADHREMAVKAAGALTAVGVVRDTTFNSNQSVAFRFELDPARLAELRERLSATGVQLDAASESPAPGRPVSANGRRNVDAILEIHFVRGAASSLQAARG